MRYECTDIGRLTPVKISNTTKKKKTKCEGINIHQCLYDCG